MFYYSTNSKSKTAHLSGCHHLKRIKPENLRLFNSIQDVRGANFKICSCCSPVLQKLKKEESEIQNYCLENGILYFVAAGQLHIQTSRSAWKVLVSGKKEGIELHHKNSYKKEYKNSVLGYHQQNIRASSILEYMQYISKHDGYRMLNPLHKKTQKPPPQKGTKRWRKQQKIAKKKKRKMAIWNVLALIDNLSKKTSRIP